jgi:hypothetical protein
MDRLVHLPAHNQLAIAELACEAIRASHSLSRFTMEQRTVAT